MLDLDWPRKDRKDSPLYYLKPSKDMRRALTKVRSFCYPKNRRQIYMKFPIS